jgi:hypothetical protein
MIHERKVSYDPKSRLATIRGPGGFTQIQMERTEAWAIAHALGVEFYVSKPGTTVRDDYATREV